MPFSLFPLAQRWVNSAVAGLINGAVPIMATIVSAVFLRVVPRPMHLLGLGLGFFGVLAISLGSAAEGASQAGGVALGVAATACYGVAINVAGPLRIRYGGVHLMSVVLTLATVMVAPFAFVDLSTNEPALVPTAALVFLGVVGTGLVYWMISALVGRVGSIRASFIAYLVPVVSLTLGVTIRGHSLGSLALIGVPSTIAGPVLAGARSRRQDPGSNR